MSFSNTAETAVLNQVFVGTALAWNANTDLWIALYEADPGGDGDGDRHQELAGVQRCPAGRVSLIGHGGSLRRRHRSAAEVGGVEIGADLSHGERVAV